MVKNLRTRAQNLKIEHVSIVPTKDQVQKAINTARLYMLCKDVVEGRLDAVQVWYSEQNSEYFDKTRAKEYVSKNQDSMNFDSIERKQRDDKGTLIVGFSAPRNILVEQRPI